MTPSTSMTPAQAVEADRGVIEPPDNPQEATRRHRRSPIAITLVASFLFAGGYAAFQRIGTTANANVVEFTRNLAGGFLAVGMTKDQPGFIALSAQDQDEVEVKAIRISNSLAGTHTVVEVQTPQSTTRIRLRGPQVFLVTAKGDVEPYPIDWTWEEFNTLRDAVDCSRAAAVKKHRCGVPFTDLRLALTKWSPDRVPDPVRAFLKLSGGLGINEHTHD